jgi:succinate-semialdehyde dehydrogenase / glutarate-semialdehyde dehydrogenase
MDTATSPLATLNDPTLLKTDGLIDGEWVAGSARFAVTDPATGLELAQVANLGAAEAEAAIVAADRAWPAWRGKPGEGALWHPDANGSRCCMAECRRPRRASW